MLPSHGMGPDKYTDVSIVIHDWDTCYTCWSQDQLRMVPKYEVLLVHKSEIASVQRPCVDRRKSWTSNPRGHYPTDAVLC